MVYHNHNIASAFKIAGLVCILWAFCCPGFSQCKSPKELWNAITSIEQDSRLTKEEKYSKFYALKIQSDSCKMIEDSGYARILDRLGLISSQLQRDFKSAIDYTEKSAKINTSGTKGASRYFAIKNYTNLGFFYDSVGLMNRSADCFDSAILLGSGNKEYTDLVIEARYRKCLLLFRKGDFQKCTEEAAIALQDASSLNDSSLLMILLNQRAQALYFQNYFAKSFEDAEKAQKLSILLKDHFELASAFKTKAMVATKVSNYKISPKDYFIKSIKERIKDDSYNYAQVADDFTDFGNYYLEIEKNYQQAKKCYLNTISYASKANDQVRIAKGNVNLGLMAIYEGNYELAGKYYSEALRIAGISTSYFLKDNSLEGRIKSYENTDLILVILGNVTEYFLKLYHNTSETRYLRATLKAANITDNIITQIRHEQIGEQSKLYWRNRTREFFSNAVEASFEANDPDHAFYFMEKSRAVLLNDKLNELGASAYLPTHLQIAEQNFRIALIEQQQKLESLREGSPEYDRQYQQYLEKKSAFDNYIKSLEKDFPVYYQYKYADAVPSINALQQYLKSNNQSFIHYFVSDSVVYILGITATGAKMMKRPVSNYNDSLYNFIQLCSDEGRLNKNYPVYSAYANSIYKTIFKDLDIPPGRVVICPDNFLIPFEALCKDEHGEKFLAYDYAFSYVYSANFLLKKFNNKTGDGNFLGFAPVKFREDNHLPSLMNSDKYLEDCANYYSNNKTLTHDHATKTSFISLLPGYEIVNVFSHARADSSNEPMLFMYDSSIKLSELQKINNPSTRLVVLSACQTSVGKNATGEGIYSLARGFAAAGIPSVAATLWKADDLTIYNITQKFNENIPTGMNKDEALQKAKLAFLEKAGTEKSMPYYWANMILVGNTDPVKLENNTTLWWYAGTAVMLALTGFGFAKRYRKKAA